MTPAPRRVSLLAAVTCAVVLAVPAPASVPGGGYAASLAVTAPGDDGPTTTSSACGAGPATGWERAEERLAGTPAWRPTLDPSPVVGFLDRTSVRCGDRVGVHLSGAARVQLSAYRVGWYGGAGARLVWTSRVRFAHAEPIPTASADTRTIETRWPSTTTIKVTQDWVPGMYLVEVRRVGDNGPVGAGAVMPLVVETTSRAPLLAVASDLTWAAYNRYGGTSMYIGSSGGYDDRSLVASMDRPLGGAGFSHLLVYDLPLARFLGRLGLDVAWTTDDALDERPSQLKGPAAVVFPGHSEYWTSRMYDAVEAARDNGLNVAFLGADPVYWQARLAPSPLGARRHLIVYRSATDDPVPVVSIGESTVRWQDAPVQRNEAQLAGVVYARSGVLAGIQVNDAPDWMLAGTGLQKGSGLPNAAANEVDRTAQVPSDAPPNDQLVFQGAYTDETTGLVSTFNGSYYTTPGGAGVFSAGTTAWSCDLDASCPWGAVPESTASAVRTITANVLRAFTTSGFTAAHASTRSQRQSPRQVWDEMPAYLRGTAGPRTVGGLDDD